MLSPTKPPIGSTSDTIMATWMPLAAASSTGGASSCSSARTRRRRSRVARSPIQLR